MIKLHLITQHPCSNQFSDAHKGGSLSLSYSVLECLLVFFFAKAVFMHLVFFFFRSSSLAHYCMSFFNCTIEINDMEVL